MRSDGKRFVWYDAQGKGRNLYGEFRRNFNLNEIPKKAEFSLFADTVYQLKVNDEFVGFGPVRFDPKFPMYDTYDLAKYLKKGENTISVIVNYFGVIAFKAILNQAGFCAWGDIVGIDVSTSADGWETRPSPERQSYMPKISFALNPIEVFEQQIDDSSYKWAPAVPLENQNAFGEFEPRSIPFMSLKELKIETKGRVYPLNNQEEISGFAITLKGKETENRDNFSNFIAFSSWVWSPKKQDIVVGTFWGELWMNGVQIPDGILDKFKVMRINQVWSLNEGWNFLFGKVGAYSNYLNQLYAVQSNLGIVFSADKKMDSPYSFRHTTELRNKEFEQKLKHKPLPYSPEDDLSEIGGWTLFNRNERINNPTRSTCWDSYAPSFEKYIMPTGPRTFKKGLYPQGFSISIDLDYIRLVFPIIKLSGVKGCTIDITHSENLYTDNQHLNHVHMYMSGDRVYCTKDEIEFMPIQPRGMRYIMITVRNTTQDVTLDSVKFLDAAYPVIQTGSFESSDELLNQIWKMCELTQRTNMEDVYVDCTTRERGMYVRDTVIQYYNNSVAYGDEPLMERCMQLYGQSASKDGRIHSVYPVKDPKYSSIGPIVDFCLDAIEGYYFQFLNTGKLEPIKRDWNAMKTNINWFERLSDTREDKLLDASWKESKCISPESGFFFFDNDIAKGQTELKGVHCGFSCYYLIALKNMAHMARSIGEISDAENYEKRAEVLSRNINKTFYDSEFGAYRENLISDLHSNQANLFAIRSGAVSSEQLPSIKKFLKRNIDGMFLDGFSNKMNTRFAPSFVFFILDALYMADLPEIAEDIIKSGWSWFLQSGIRQCAEYFDLNGALSHCHAWSASPIYFLSRNISGVRYPDAPNLDLVEIDIKTSVVQWAKVTLPHPKGTITVEWHTEDDKKVMDSVKTPYGVAVSVLK